MRKKKLNRHSLVLEFVFNNLVLPKKIQLDCYLKTTISGQLQLLPVLKQDFM